MRVLFIAYYLDTSISVGAQRISYWASNLSKLGSNVTVEIITANTNLSELPGVEKIHIVRNTKKPGRLIADEGHTWKPTLLKYIRNMRFDFDWVIMSGGPFMYFGISDELKSEFKTKVLLDFRDPFARNPRFDNTYMKVAAKAFYEKKFIKSADKIVTVNEICVELLKYPGVPDDKYSIIQNGYNESLLDSVSIPPSERGRAVEMVYSGTFFDDRNPSNFLNVIGQADHADSFNFKHVGRSSDFIESRSAQSNIQAIGLLSYAEMLKTVSKSDVGLIFTSGESFESTTKIFDYIGLSKAILIVTEGAVKTGNLHTITKGYPKVFWCENNKASIENVLKKIASTDLKVEFATREEYSRKAGLNKLAALINLK